MITRHKVEGLSCTPTQHLLNQPFPRGPGIWQCLHLGPMLSLDGFIQPTRSSLHESHMFPLFPSQSCGTQPPSHSPGKKMIKGRTCRSERGEDDVLQDSMQDRQDQTRAKRQRAHFLPVASGAPAVPAVPQPGSRQNSRSSPGVVGLQEEGAQQGGRGTAQGPGQAGEH